MKTADWLSPYRLGVEQDQATDTAFGKWIFEMRKFSSLSQRDAAAASGIPVARWTTIEMGAPLKKGATKAECVGIAQALSLPLDAVLKKAIGEKYEAIN